VGAENPTDHYGVINSQFADNPVLRYLRNELDTPLFLGLERRYIGLHFDDEGKPGDAGMRRRMIMMAARRRMLVSGQLGSSLVDVQVLIQDVYRKTREIQENFTTQLRQEVFLDAFDFQPGAGFFRALREGKTVTPFLKSIIGRRGHVEKALTDAGVDPKVFGPVLNKFFLHIEELLDKAQKMPGRGSRNIHDITVELAFNRPVVDRISKLISSAETYNAKVRTLWAPIHEFLELANRFLIDSGKQLEIDQVGWLVVRLPDGTARSLDVLSSGERQIVVILGHLAITREQNRAGVFVVDEPELSLHLKWQQIFVDSMLKASPKNQFILATHSPAIVMERDRYCRSLDKKPVRQKGKRG